MVSSAMKTGLFLGFGSVLVLIGAIMAACWPPLFMNQLMKMMIVTNESMSFEMWREPPIPMYLECFLFNISNVNEILADRNVKPHLVQFGPYVYRETHTKANLTWNNHNDTLTYFNQRWWHFQPDMSNGSLSDNITNVNPIVVTVAYDLRYNSVFEKTVADVFLRLIHENMFVTANASSWLFDGIDDPLLTVASHIPFLPREIPYDKFGWFYDRNGSLTFDGSLNMNTGASDFSQLGNIEMWRYSNRTMYREECGQVRGSAGELWAPELGQPEVYVFAPDMCTYLILSKDGDNIVEGVTGVQYAANDSVFDNGHKYPHMACYCGEVRDADCVPPGALNVSACRFGAPAFVSLPHLYHADPHYPSRVDGLHPTPEHRFRLTLEMFTGMPLQVAAQLQINFLVRHYEGMSLNNQLPDDTLVPMFWFRQEVQTTEEYAHQARLALRLRYWVPYAFYALTAIGLILLIPGVVILYKRRMNSSSMEPIIHSDAAAADTQ
ncbi:protein croquemort-like [Achroia grisella]|uniref:protein croquemort-like n=1 Tax=Achroia grisella TaxID=688607 RepID=UPI0027D3487D|nr:protein croquemort-like [Achroia grisella]